MTGAMSGNSTVNATEVGAVMVPRSTLCEPLISDRSVFPARHTIIDGLSPWELAVSADVRESVATLRWSVTSYGPSQPVADSPVVATDTLLTVEVFVVGHDGVVTSMGTSECTMRTELDSRSLADRQITGHGWLLPYGYTVVIEP
jgi:hypothetical protein